MDSTGYRRRRQIAAPTSPPPPLPPTCGPECANAFNLCLRHGTHGAPATSSCSAACVSEFALCVQFGPGQSGCPERAQCGCWPPHGPLQPRLCHEAAGPSPPVGLCSRRALLSLPFVFSMDQDMLAALVRSPQVQAPLVVSARLPAQRRRRWQHLVVAAQAAAAIARRALRVVQLNSPCACSMGQAIQYARTSWPPVVAPWRACA